jgi:2,4-dienoyl-CoA reductase-like NADH-dependent reductase (Old Yellow Enzyme family)
MPTVLADELGPFGRNVPASAAIRAAVREAGFDTPIVISGGIYGFEQAEAILARGEADVVGAARQSLADPDWYRKIRLGRGAEVRRCVFTNYCEGLDQMHKQVTCKLWDRVPRDAPDIEASPTNRSVDGKRRLTAPLWSAEPVQK